MAAGRIFIPGWMPARDSDGAPIPNVSAYFYQNKTDILATVYADEALTTPLSNPVQANSSGRFPQIYADDANLFSASVDAPYGPPGQPFTFDDLSPSQAADIAAANLAQGAAEDSEAALAAVEAAIEAATEAGGGDAALAGAIAGQEAGTDAANAVVANKLDKLASLATLPALAGSKAQVAIQYRTAPGDGYAGTFEWIAGDQSANVTADPLQGVWVAPAAAPTGSSGAWKRVHEGPLRVEWFGAKCDGITNDSTAVQALIDYIWMRGGGTAILPAKTLRVANIRSRDNVTLVGTYGQTVLKLIDGSDKQIFYNGDQSTGVTVDFWSLEGLILDGNKDNVAGLVAASACAVNGVKDFTARDCIFRNSTGYGLAFQSYPGGSLPGVQQNIFLQNCHFLDNGDGVGGDTYDGLDIKYCDTLVMLGCTAKGNADQGINVRGRRVFIGGCDASDNLGNGFGFTGNHLGLSLPTSVTIVGSSAYNNGSAGLAAADGVSGALASVRVMAVVFEADGNNVGVAVPSQSSKTALSLIGGNIINSVSHGVSVDGTPESVVISGAFIQSNGGSGVYTNAPKVQIDTCVLTGNARYGIEEGASGTRTIVAGATRVEGNSLGGFLWGANGRRTVSDGVIDFNLGSGDVIASAATITLPEGGDYFVVTGTTNITSVSPSRRGRRVTLGFTGVLTVTDGSNLGLAGNFITSSADTLTLVSDGATWFEIGRSVN